MKHTDRRDMKKHDAKKGFHQIIYSFWTHYKVKNRVRWLPYFSLHLWHYMVIYFLKNFIYILFLSKYWLSSTQNPKTSCGIRRALWGSSHCPYTLDNRCLDGRISLIHIWICAVVIWTLLWRKRFIFIYMLTFGLVSSQICQCSKSWSMKSPSCWFWVESANHKIDEQPQNPWQKLICLYVT